MTWWALEISFKNMNQFLPTPNFWTVGLVYYCETVQIDMFYLNGWISTRAFVAMQTIKDVDSILQLFKCHLLYKMYWNVRV